MKHPENIEEKYLKMNGRWHKTQEASKPGHDKNIERMLLFNFITGAPLEATV